MVLSSRRAEYAVRLGVFFLALIPIARLLVHALTDGLGANPIEELTRTNPGRGGAVTRSRIRRCRP